MCIGGGGPNWLGNGIQSVITGMTGLGMPRGGTGGAVAAKPRVQPAAAPATANPTYLTGEIKRQPSGMTAPTLQGAMQTVGNKPTATLLGQVGN